MVSKWRKIGFATVWSTLCLGGTLFWDKYTSKSNGSTSNEKKIAYIVKLTDKIERRPARRRLSQAASEGDSLFNGDAIRTGSIGDVRIQFQDTNRYLDLEPDSLIVLQKSNGEIALDLMEGSVVAKSNDLPVNASPGDGSVAPPTPGLVLKTSKGKIDISKASIALTKGKTSKTEDFQVLEGSAHVKDDSGKTTEVAKGDRLGVASTQFNPESIQIISPKLDVPSYVDPDHAKPIVFQWDGFPADHVVTLKVGKSRNELQDIATTKVSTEKQLHAPLVPGKYYWRLSGKDLRTGKVDADSRVFRLEILPRYAPTVIFPLADARILMDKSPYDLTIKWDADIESSRVILEVARDPSLKQMLVNQAFKDQDHHTLTNLKEGPYFWRISTQYANDSQVYSSAVNKFLLTKKEIMSLAQAPPPTPLVVKFTNPEAQQIQYYIDKPQLNLSWITDKEKIEKVKMWRLKVYEEQQGAEHAQVITLKELKTDLPVNQPGRYIASIDALDGQGTVLGGSTARTFNIAQMPLIASPKFNIQDGIYTASLDGKTDIGWDTVSGAKEYHFTINDKDGHSRTMTYKEPKANLKNLLPGEYKIQVAARDQYGRPSQGTGIGKIIVPDKSSLRAPALRSKKVKSDDE